MNDTMISRNAANDFALEVTKDEVLIPFYKIARVNDHLALMEGLNKKRIRSSSQCVKLWHTREFLRSVQALDESSCSNSLTHKLIRYQSV